MIKKIISLSLAVVISAICVTGVLANAPGGWQDIEDLRNDPYSMQVNMFDELGNVAPTGYAIVPTVVVNGTAFEFDAFALNYNNYFKLRDLAYILNGTSAQFEVGFDAVTNTVLITSGQPYTIVGGEMANTHRGLYEEFNTVASGVTVSTSRFMVDGESVNFRAYNFTDNNFVKLRDIAVILDFFVDWDGRILIDTSRSYVPESAEAIAAREERLRAREETNQELEREFQESRERFTALENFIMNTPGELIPESVKTFTDIYEFDMGHGRPVWFQAFDGFAEYNLDENGVLLRERSSWGVWDDGTGFILMIKYNGDGTFTGMVYQMQVPVELILN